MLVHRKHGRGVGDAARHIIGFISHLSHSPPVALGAAASFVYRSQPCVALTFTGDGMPVHAR